MQTNYAAGLSAEARALEYLIAQGYALIAQRYRNRYGEIDIIVQRGGVVHFTEVKARPTLEAGLLSLAAKQQQRLWNCALGFVAQHPQFEGYAMQMDLIVIAGSQLHHEMNILSEQ